MERVAWTDERLDDLSRRMDAGFDRVDRDIRDLRGDMNAGFAELRGEIGASRGLMIRGGVGLMVGMLGILGTVLAHSV